MRPDTLTVDTPISARLPGRATPVHSRATVLRGAITVAMAAGLSCGNPTAPLEPAAFAPELQGAELDASRLVDEGLIAFILTPADAAYRLGRHRFLVASITSTGGEQEEIRVRPRICDEGEHGTVLCDYLIALV